MRISVIFSSLLLAVPLGFASDENPNGKDYVKHTFGPTSAVRAGAGAGVNQLNDTPTEWHQGAEGFGKRFASSFGKHIVKKTIEFPIAKWRHEPFFYRPSDKVGFKARSWNAISNVFVVNRTTDGKPVVHTAEIGGALGSGLISRAWQPASTATLATGFESMGLTFATDIGGNFVHEFWPEIRHPHSHAAVRAEREQKLEAKEQQDRVKKEAKAAAKAAKREQETAAKLEQQRGAQSERVKSAKVEQSAEVGEPDRENR